MYVVEVLKMKAKIDEWTAIEKVSRNETDEIYRKLCYSLVALETGIKRLQKLRDEIWERHGEK